jgi:N-acetylglucosaminyldiphosphoundecaprenol N-acetyl-beta-D-mannosaminyltransferase
MYHIGGLTIFSGSISDVVGVIEKWVENKKRSYVCVTGAHGVVESQQSGKVLRAHRHAGLIVPDGMPLVGFGVLRGFPQTKRIYGPDLFIELCKRAEKKKWRIFLYGTTEDTLIRLQKQLHHNFPKLIIVGSYAPPFRALTPKEEKEIIVTINESRPHIVFVGLSTPKQELWMHTHSQRLTANALIGVGAAFDFVSGTKKQAPRWIQRTGFEWLFRFSQEPSRLWYRYTVGNLRFLRLLITDLVFPK